MSVLNYYNVESVLIGEQAVGSARRDYLNDAIGSITGTVNASGQVESMYRYKPYGQTLFQNTSGVDPAFQWIGQLGYRRAFKKYSDVYVRARHYGTNEGRWTTPDPLGYIESTNRYVYAAARPTVLTDASGLLPRSVKFCIDDSPDDTPSLGTRYIMQVLKNGGKSKKDIKAYFFLIGVRVDKMPDIVNDMKSAGHILGNHTQNHPQPFGKLTEDQMYKELCVVHETLKNKFNYTMNLYRAPGESRDGNTGEAIAWDRIHRAALRVDPNYKALMDASRQTIFTSNDKYKGVTEDKAFASAINWLKGRRSGTDVILCFHDPLVTTAFLRRLIDWIDAQGISIRDAN